MDVELEIPPLPPPQQQGSLLSCNDGNMNNLSLNQQAMVNQFISIAGCSIDQAFYLLSSSNWQYQVKNEKIKIIFNFYSNDKYND